MRDSKAVLFAGRIHPERAAVEFGIRGAEDTDLRIEIGLASGHRLPARVTIDASQVVVAMAAPDPLDDILTLKNGLQSLVASFVDVVGWLNGCGYLTEMTTYATSEAQGVFGVQVPVLAAKTSRLDATTIFQLVAAGPDSIYLRRALADMRSAILSPDDTPFFCFRAAESLLHHFSGGKGRSRAAMAKSLRIEDGWIVDWLQRPSNDIRHGSAVPVVDEQRQRSFLAAREVIERYMVWLTGARVALSPSEFPRLRRADDPLLLRA